MCGITGFIDLQKRSSEKTLRSMTNTLTHRGPDGDGQILIETEAGQIGLGHRRLSVIDLSVAASQPMRYKHLFIVYNGEIYNHRSVRTELEKLGHLFTTSSDTEVILHAFEQWGTDCLERFIGMFAFCIYDETENEMICVRDRTGIKPFYYYRNSNLFLFSSELKAFHEHGGFIKELNHDAVAAFLQYGNIPAPYCIYKDCYKLKPGHFLRFKLSSDEFSVYSYWNVYDHYNQPKTTVSFSEAKLKCEELLQSAFEYRMVSDVPVGIFLSGGYDSTCVTALLQKDRKEKLNTFTISVPDIGLNEAPFAKIIAKHLGTEHREFECTQKEALELISEIPYHYDEPFADSSAIPTMLVSKKAREYVTVALSADGGDELFAGYNRYDYLMKYGKNLNRIPGFIRKGSARLLNILPADRIPLMKNTYNFHHRYEKLKGLLNDPSPDNLMRSLSTQFSEKELRKLLLKKASPLSTAYSSKELKTEFYDPLSFMMAIDFQTYLPDDILQKVDRATMYASLEGREPFLDHRIIEFAAQLPNSYKYRRRSKKYILKEIVHQYVPEKLMDRPKMGFAIPLYQWLKNDLSDIVKSHLNLNVLKEQGVFDSKAVHDLMSEFYSGKKEITDKIWYLLMFQMWYRRWFA